MLNTVQRDLIKFEYTREPLHTNSTDAFSGYDAIRNSVDEKILGVFKSNQYIISHTEAANKVESAFEEMGFNPEVTQFELMKNGAELFVHYKCPDALNIDLGSDIPGVPGSDVLIPEIILRNGYDGKTTFGLEYSLSRLVCSNGLRLMVMGNRSVSKMYMGDVDIAVLVAGMREFCEVLLINLKVRIQAMIGTTNPEMREDVRDFVCESLSNKLLGVYDQQIEYLENEIGQERINLWHCYNVLTFMITHMMNSYSRRRSVELNISKRFGLTVTPGSLAIEES